MQTNSVCTELVRERAPTAPIAPIPLPLTFAETFSHRSYEIYAFLIFGASSGSASTVDVRTTSRLTELLPTPPKRSQNGPELMFFFALMTWVVWRDFSPFLDFSWLGRDALRRHAAVTWQLPFSCHGLPQLLDPNATHHST